MLKRVNPEALEDKGSGVIPIEYTRYGDLRVGDWIAFEHTVA